MKLSQTERLMVEMMRNMADSLERDSSYEYRDFFSDMKKLERLADKLWDQVNGGWAI